MRKTTLSCRLCYTLILIFISTCALKATGINQMSGVLEPDWSTYYVFQGDSINHYFYNYSEVDKDGNVLLLSYIQLNKLLPDNSYQTSLTFCKFTSDGKLQYEKKLNNLIKVFYGQFPYHNFTFCIDSLNNVWLHDAFELFKFSPNMQLIEKYKLPESAEYENFNLIYSSNKIILSKKNSFYFQNLNQHYENVSLNYCIFDTESKTFIDDFSQQKLGLGQVDGYSYTHTLLAMKNNFLAYIYFVPDTSFYSQTIYWFKDAVIKKYDLSTFSLIDSIYIDDFFEKNKRLKYKFEAILSIDNDDNIVISSNAFCDQDSFHIIKKYSKDLIKLSEKKYEFRFWNLYGYHHNINFYYYNSLNHSLLENITFDKDNNIYLLSNFIMRDSENYFSNYPNSSQMYYHRSDTKILKLSPTLDKIWEISWDGKKSTHQKYSDNLEFHVGNEIFFKDNSLYITGYTSCLEGVSYGDAHMNELEPFKDKYIPSYDSTTSSNSFVTKFFTDSIGLHVVDTLYHDLIDTLDLGNICLDNLIEEYLLVRNASEFPIEIIKTESSDDIILNYKYMRDPKLNLFDTVGFKIEILPKELGEHLIVIDYYCDKRLGILKQLYIKFNVVHTLLVSDADLDFGILEPGDSKYLTINITNQGDTDAYIETLPDLPEGFSYGTVDPRPPVFIPPGGKMEILVKCNAEEEVEISETLAIISMQFDSSCPYELNINLSMICSVEKYNIDIFPEDMSDQIEEFHFGKLCVGEEKTVELVLQNNSDFDYTLKDLEYSNHEDFTVELLEKNKHLKKGDTVRLKILCHPQDYGQQESVVRFYSTLRKEELGRLKITCEALASYLMADKKLISKYIKENTEIRDTIRIQNFGNTGAWIKKISDILPPFYIENTNPLLPYYLKAGEELAVAVLIKSSSLGEFNSEIQIESIKTDSSCNSNEIINLECFAVDKYIITRSPEFEHIASCTTSTSSAFLHYIGEEEINILNYEIQGGDEDKFSVESIDPMKLNYDEEAEIKIVFDPQGESGNYSSELLITTDLSGQDKITIPLTASSEKITLSSDILDFGNIALDIPKTITEAIKNSSSFQVHISDIKSSESWLQVSYTEDIIDPGFEIDIDLIATITTPGQYKGHIIVYIDQPCIDSVLIPVKAASQKSELDHTETIDIGKLEYCQTKIMEFEIENLGNLPVEIRKQELVGEDAELFRFTSDFELTEILPDSVYIREIIFTPGASEAGVKKAEIISTVLLDGVEEEFRTTITAEKVEPKIKIKQLQQIECEVTKNKKFEIEIGNEGDLPFSLTGLSFTDKIHFNSLINSSDKIEKNEKITNEIDFNPKDYGKHSDVLKLRYRTDNCDYEEEVKFTGIGYLNTLITLPDTSNVISDTKLCVPLQGQITTDYNQLVTSDFTAEIRHNNKIFLPDENFQIENNQFVVDISGSAQINQTGVNIYDYCGQLMLFNDESKELQIRNFKWDNEFLRVQTEDGALDLEGICARNLRQVRFFDRTKMQIQENRINISSEERGQFTLSVYSTAGILQETSIWENDSKFEKEINLNKEIYSSGLYFITLQTPMGVLSEKWVVLK